MNNNDKLQYKEKIISTLQKRVVPEFGEFEPISVIFDDKDNNRLTFTVAPDYENSTGKQATFAFVSSKTGRLAFISRNFADKNKLDNYLKTLSDDDIHNIKRELKKKTES